METFFGKWSAVVCGIVKDLIYSIIFNAIISLFTDSRFIEVTFYQLLKVP